MFEILKKERLNAQVILMKVHAPHIAKKAMPGQFIILRVNENGERIPLTIADVDLSDGSVTIIFQTVGKTTQLLGTLEKGNFILDFVGPLGQATHFGNPTRVAVVGGGLGTAIAYPSARALFAKGANVDIIAGFRTKDLIILERELSEISNRMFITTDDGSNGLGGFVSDILRQQIISGVHYDLVVAIGPLVMMKVVSEITRQYGIRTIVSMNPIMIDGTGMCGGCRITVNGEIKFACVDGPDFDGHQVDFDEAIRRSRVYLESEKLSANPHLCRVGSERNA